MKSSIEYIANFKTSLDPYNGITILSEDLPKDKPSLFDSLLKTSIEDIENSSAQNTNSKIVSQNITSNLEKSPLDAEVIEVNTKLIDEGLDSEAINLDENSNSEEVIKDLSKNIDKKGNLKKLAKFFSDYAEVFEALSKSPNSNKKLFPFAKPKRDCKA